MLFAAPLGYLAWRTVDRRRVAARSCTRPTATLRPAAQHAGPGAATAASTAVVGHRAGLADHPHRPAAAAVVGGAGRRCRWCSRRSSAPWPCWRRCRPGGLLDATARLGGRRAVPARGLGSGAWLVLTLFTPPYVLLPVGARLAALPPSLEESARLLGRRPVAVFRTVVLPQIRRRRLGRHAAGLPLHRQRLRGRGAAALRHAHRVDLRQPAVRPGPVGGPQPAAGAAGPGGGGRRADAGPAPARGRGARGPGGRSRCRSGAGGGRRWRWWSAWVGAGARRAAGVARPVGVAGPDRRDERPAAGGRGLGDLASRAVNTAGIGLVTAVVAVVGAAAARLPVGRYRARSGRRGQRLVATGFALPGLVVALAAGLLERCSCPRRGASTRASRCWCSPTSSTSGPSRCGPPRWRWGRCRGGWTTSARMLGAGRARRFVTVDLPLMLPGLVAGGGLVLLSTMKELPITLLLRPIGFETLATAHLGRRRGAGSWRRPALASIVLVGAVRPADVAGGRAPLGPAGVSERRERASHVPARPDGPIVMRDPEGSRHPGWRVPRWRSGPGHCVGAGGACPPGRPSAPGPPPTSPSTCSPPSAWRRTATSTSPTRSPSGRYRAVPRGHPAGPDRGPKRRPRGQPPRPAAAGAAGRADGRWAAGWGRRLTLAAARPARWPRCWCGRRVGRFAVPLGVGGRGRRWPSA